MRKPKRAAKHPERANKDHNLFLRAGTWYMEYTHDGKRYRESLDTSDRGTARERRDERIKEISQGIPRKKFSPIPCQEMFDKWMAEVERTCKPNTIEDYRRRWNAHLKGFFGGLMATQVNRQKVTDYLLQRKNEGAGEVTQNRENRILQMLFNYNRTLIPADHFPEFPKMHSEKMHVRKGRLSVEDYREIQRRLTDPKLFWLRVMLTLAFKYGFRTKSELVPAKVSYFDPKASTFTLPPFSTKNKMDRVVDLVPNGEIYNMLVELAAGRNPEDALFHRNGKAVRDFRGTWDKLVEGMKGGSGKGGTITIHDLRRSALTNMTEKGVTAVQAGTHLSPEVFSRYINRNQEERRRTAELIEGGD